MKNNLSHKLLPDFPPRPRGGFLILFQGEVSGQRSDRGVKEVQPTKSAKPTLRDDWPFLSLPSCPSELKILAANKITAYHRYCAAHMSLFDCTNADEQFETVKQLVENFIENRQILDEFEHYKQHNHTLGVHPIFKELEALKQLRSLSSIELYQKQEKLKHNIWRIEKELSKNDKPELRVEREKRLQHKKNELAEVERLLSESFPGEGTRRAGGVEVIAPAKNHPKDVYWFECPGCGGVHEVNTSKHKKPCWGFNNDLIEPTFTPSILTFFPQPSGKREVVCHSFVTDGKIRFLNDCPHKLKGKTVPLPPINKSEWYGKI